MITTLRVRNGLITGHGEPLPATPENAASVRASLNGERVMADAAFRALLAGQTGQPPVRRSDAWGHQVEAYHQLMAHPQRGLDIDMGGGKSKIVIDYIQNSPHLRRVLIVAPAEVVTGDVWPTQVERHAAAPLELVELRPGTSVAQRVALAKKALTVTDRQAVYLTNVEAFWQGDMGRFWPTAGLDAVVYDESHRLKAPGGKAARYAYKLTRHVQRRVGLTGTLVPHSWLDVFAQCRALDPDLFGPYVTRFRARYAVMNPHVPGMVLRWVNLDELKARLDRLWFRAHGMLDLPGETPVDRWVEMPPEGMRAYREMERDFYARVASGEITARNALVKALRLRQMANGWATAEDSEGEKTVARVHAAKQSALSGLLSDMGNEAAVVFCRFHADLDAVREACPGALEHSGREKNLAAWQAGQGRVLAIQHRSGGTGIDLTRARYGIFYSLPDSGGDYQQLLKRLHRPGQTRPVTFYYLKTKGTVDAVVHRALTEKIDLVKAILEGRNA
jgi:superfamily II DNA or RNA helicase